MKETTAIDRLLAVGDIHGCLDPLERLLDEVRPTARDQLVFLGDYIDRGPDSCGVVECLLRLQRRLPQTVFLKGNHEQMLLDFLQGRQTALYLYNGGDATLASYRQRGLDGPPPSHREFFHQLRLRFVCGDFIFVHAGLRPGVPVAAQTEEDLLWIRDTFLDSRYSWGKTVVFGHTPLPRPLERPERLGLDTGAVYGRRLTCCDVLRRRYWAF